MLDRLVFAPLRDLATPAPGRRPALDALRSLAVLLIVAEHARGGYLESGGIDGALTRSPLVRGGWTGIDLWFALAGFLAGRQLFGELAARGAVDLRRFALRRALRALPLYAAFYLASALLIPRSAHPGALLWPDATFTTNYAGHGLIPGSWMVCTVTQFYLVALLILAAARSPRAARQVLAGVLLMFPAARALAWWKLTGAVLFHHDAALFLDRFFRPLHLHADPLFLGLALASFPGERDAGEARAWPPARLLGCAALAGLLAVVHREAFLFSALALLAGAAVRRAAAPGAQAPALLRWRGFHVISRLSFGVVLSHRFLEDAVAGSLVGRVPLGTRFPALGFAVVYAALMLASALAATIAFCLVESPFLRLRAALDARGRPPGGA